MIPEQYPDTLTRENGSTVKCRFYPYQGQGIVKVVDGAEVKVKYVIALPVDAPMLLIGEVVTATDKSGETIVWNDSIALFHRGQFHCKAYV